MAEPSRTEEDVRLSHGIPLAHAVRTDVGSVRTNNEDSQGLFWLDDGSMLAMVCDGMGGHEAGEVASQLAVEVIHDVMTRHADDPRGGLHEALLTANQAILDEGRQAGKRGMGTTAVVTAVRGRQAWVGLVGDSRLFHVRGGHVIERTVDHTRVQSLLDRGMITAEEAKDHPDVGMLTRALGHAKMSNGKPLEPEVFAEPLALQDGDALVLSSDGLHDLVEDWEIGATVAGCTPEVASSTLVDLALQRGGHDNVTVLVVTVGGTAGAYQGDRPHRQGGNDDPTERHAALAGGTGAGAVAARSAPSPAASAPAPARDDHGGEVALSPARDRLLLVGGFAFGITLFLLAMIVTIVAMMWMG
ncbi:MAG: serine/threonine-protein phosphatase [Alphaproteobacteria bacterium]|nr:serine/threonine-protein phosphatase [Alphaproteobacteria bacterium]